MKILRNFFVSIKTNIKSILTALISSAIIWCAISLQIFPDVSATINDIPVQINLNSYMLDNNLRLAEEYELITSVKISGKRYDIGKLGSNNFDAHLDFSNVVSEGEHDVYITVTPNSPLKFEIISEKQTAHIKVERIESKTLEISPKADSVRVVEGMQIDQTGITANPPFVTISGEKSIIDSIERAEVVAVFEDEMVSTYQVEGRLELFNYENIRVNHSDIKFDNDYFTVTVPIHKVKTLPLDFLITGYHNNFNIAGLKDKMTITPSDLTLSAPDMSIDHLAHFEVGEMRLNDITLQMLQSPTRDTIAPKLPEGYKNISGDASFAIEFTGVEDYRQVDFAVSRDESALIAV
ncbi:MAG: hypothetical protein FWG44_08300, partial [Oscillospiraceae bacterium]|nr:hypothetical protein [Oscillospiraceae bacterium]